LAQYFFKGVLAGGNIRKLEKVCPLRKGGGDSLLPVKKKTKWPGRFLFKNPELPLVKGGGDPYVSAGGGKCIWEVV